MASEISILVDFSYNLPEIGLPCGGQDCHFFRGTLSRFATTPVQIEFPSQSLFGSRFLEWQDETDRRHYRLRDGES